jgi:hypothetical protein
MRTKILTLCFTLVVFGLLPSAKAQFTYTTNSGAIAITDYTGTDRAVTIPDTINGYPVISIGNNAFLNCGSLTSVTIPNSVTNLGGEAFYACLNLTSVTFQGNAPGLGISVFDHVAAGATVYYYYGTSGWGTTYGGLPTVELDAPNPPQIGSVSIGMPSGNFSFMVTGVSNQTIVVEASTNLVSWQPVWTNTLSGTTTNFTDPQWTNYSSRFYRAQ